LNHTQTKVDLQYSNASGQLKVVNMKQPKVPAIEELMSNDKRA